MKITIRKASGAEALMMLTEPARVDAEHFEPSPAFPTESETFEPTTNEPADPRPDDQQPAPAPPPPAPPNGTRELVAAESFSQTFTPLKFDTAADFMMAFCEEFELYPWQCEELLRLSGFSAPGRSPERLKPTAQNPLLYNLVATNGSGKDAVILAGFILWFISCKTRAMVIATSFTESQIDRQTFKHCKFYAERINNILGREFFETKYLNITCPETGSEARLFVTNKAGRAEGYHANPGAEFAFIVNEAKSIEDELRPGFLRYSGWNYWIEVSSAGSKSGVFYRNTIDPEAVHYPNPLRLGYNYVRRIKLKDCPRLVESDVRLKKIIREFGVGSPVYLSVVNSEFSDDSDVLVLIKPSAVEYQDPAPNDYNLPLVAGVDLALGGDETVVSIWQGNRRVAQRTLRERFEPDLHLWLIDVFNEYKLIPENIAADAGGLGKPIIHRLIAAGWNVNPFNFGGAAKNKTYYLNRGAELWNHLKRLTEERVLVLPRDDYKFMEQLTSRRYTYSNGKMKLESKEEARARGEESPDRVDAAVMAWSLVDFDTFDTARDGAEQAAIRAERARPTLPSFEQAQRFIEERRNSTAPPPLTTVTAGPTRNNYGRLCRILGLR